MKSRDAIEATKIMKPQDSAEVMPGLTVRRTIGGVLVPRLHYSAHPERDPEEHPEWKEEERKTYTSQAGWDREQEIVDEAGGGELVLADTLVTFWDKIVITDPVWMPDKRWTVLGGFDHGKTNPTCLERAYVDFDGVIIFCGEYYQPGLEVWRNAPEILKMPDVNRFECCYADPSIFDQKTQQVNQKQARAIAAVYLEKGINFLTRFNKNRNDQTFVERVLAHWGNLSQRKPTLQIVCRNYSDRPQPGRHDWDCPNLLWELMRTRKRKLSATQLMTQNQAEEIIDKDNHARDACKYVVMSLPDPTQKTREEKIAEKLEVMRQQGVDDYSLNIHRARLNQQAVREAQHDQVHVGRRYGIPIRRN